MSTTQGPYTVLHERSGLYGGRGHFCLVHPNGKRSHMYLKDGRLQDLAKQLNAAYAAGQRSKQAELDKAVGLLRELTAECPESYADGSYHLDVALKAARAYLSTLNPQPDAAQ